MIKTLAETIIWIAKKRIEKGDDYKNINSAIHAITMEVSAILMEFMKEQ